MSLAAVRWRAQPTLVSGALVRGGLFVVRIQNPNPPPVARPPLLGHLLQRADGPKDLGNEGQCDASETRAITSTETERRTVDASAGGMFAHLATA